MFMQELLDLQREFGRLFGAEPFAYASLSQRSFPLANLFDKDNMLVLKAEAPGIDKKDLEVELRQDVLRVSGKRRSEPVMDGFYHRRERDGGEFVRQFKLPVAVNQEKVSASYVDGILTVELEKAESAKSRKIAIR